jgi:hypothetical protein
MAGRLPTPFATAKAKSVARPVRRVRAETASAVELPEHHPSIRTDFVLYSLLFLEQEFRSDESI